MNWFKALGARLSYGNQQKQADANKGKSLTNFRLVSTSKELEEVFQNENGKVITPRQALNARIVTSCVSLIAGSISQLPIRIVNKLPDGNYEQSTEHNRIDYLLNCRANEDWNSSSLINRIICEVLLRGDSFCMAIRNSRGEVTEIMPLIYSHVRVDYDKNTGRVFYEVNGTLVPKRYILHFTGKFFDGQYSLSVLQTGGAEGIALHNQLEDYVKSTFSDTALQDYMFKFKAGKTPEQLEAFRSTYKETYSGTEKRGDVFTFPDDYEMVQIERDLSQQQLLQSREDARLDIARLFHCPSALINIENRGSGQNDGVQAIYAIFLKSGLMPHIKMIEHELSYKLFPRSIRDMNRNDPTTEVKFNTEALLRGTPSEQADMNMKALGNNTPWKTQDEVRRESFLPPLPPEESPPRNVTIQQPNREEETQDEQ